MDKQNTIDNDSPVVEILSDSEKTPLQQLWLIWKLFSSNSISPEEFSASIVVLIGLNYQPFWGMDRALSGSVANMLSTSISADVSLVYDNFKSTVLSIDNPPETDANILKPLLKQKLKKEASKIIRDAVNEWRSKSPKKVGELTANIIFDRDYIDKGDYTLNKFAVEEALWAITEDDSCQKYVVPQFLKLLEDCRLEYEHSVSLAIRYLSEKGVVEAFDLFKKFEQDKSHPYSGSAKTEIHSLIERFPEHFPEERYKWIHKIITEEEEDRRNGLIEVLEVIDGKFEVLKLTEEEIARKKAENLSEILIV